MEIQIYTISACDYCTKIKQVLERAELPYKQILVGRDMTKDEFKTLYPKVSGFPLVVIDGVVIGGLMDSVKYFVEKGLVKSKRRS